MKRGWNAQLCCKLKSDVMNYGKKDENGKILDFFLLVICKSYGLHLYNSGRFRAYF